MKYIRYFFTIFVCMIAVNVYAATSNFEPTINMAPDITENQISVIVGYKGENIMALTQNIAYEREYLTLIDVTMMDNFVVTKGNEQQEGNFQTIKLLADSDYAFEDINYAVLTFELKDKFKVGKSSKVFMYTYEAAGPNKDKYRHKGYEMTLRRDDVGEMAFLLKAIDSSTKREYWLSQNYLIIIAVVLVLVGIVATIFLIPSKRKKEKRAEKIREELNGNKQVSEKKSKDIAPIKIDYDMIEDIGTVKKEVDMSQAIEVSDLKPFGNAEGKYSTESHESNNIDGVNIQQNSMSQLNPTNQMVAETMAPPMQATVEMQAMASENNKAEAPAIDAFSMKIDNTPIPSQESIAQEIVNTDESQRNDTLSAGIQELPEEKQEDLILFQPTFGDNEENNSNNGNNNIMSLILLLIVSVGLLIPNIRALEYRVEELRDCIVGNIPYDKELDYNNDGKVDVADIIETKDLSNTSLEPDAPTHNFKPIENEGGYVTEPITEPVPTVTTTTEKTTKFNLNTTTKRTTTKNTPNKTTTTKTTTTKKTTTKKTTTTKTQAPTYTVSLVTNHSSANKNSASVVSGKSTSFTVTPNTGYTFDSASCTGGASVTYSKTSKKLDVKNVTSNVTCTANFKERDDMKVTISATHGKVSPATLKGAYKSSVSSTVSPSTGYQYKSHSCTNGLSATYDTNSNSLVIKSLTDDGSCKVVFEEKTFQMTVKVSGIEKKFSAKYNVSTDYTFETNKNLTKLKCNGLTRVFTKNDLGNGSYKYVFSYKMTKDTTCEYS